MKREKKEAQRARGKFECPPDPLLAKLPKLAEAVADCFWDDGQPREPWSLSVNWSTGACLVQLNDKEQGRSVASTAMGLSEALLMLEGMLESGQLPWRYWKQQAKRK